LRGADPTGQCCHRRCAGTIFLLSLVLTASMMPVERLPGRVVCSRPLGLGFHLGAVFDNIPLTKLALEQGGIRLGVCSRTQSALAAR
jgi:hypothetical protein